MSKILTLDPTDRARQILVVEESGQTREISWDSSADKAGGRLCAELNNLQLTAADELRVVTGPGHYSALRVAAAVANATHLVTGVSLRSRTITDAQFHLVEQIEPFYTEPPRLG